MELEAEPALVQLVQILVDGEGDAGAVEPVRRVLPYFRVLRRLVLKAVPPVLLTVFGDGSGFVLPDGRCVDLSRRGSSTRNLLVALAAASAAGQRLTVSDAFEAGWPGDRIRWESARQRVYVTIATLRMLGLEEILDSNDLGYLLMRPVRLTP